MSYELLNNEIATFYINIFMKTNRAKNNLVQLQMFTNICNSTVHSVNMVGYVKSQPGFYQGNHLWRGVSWKQRITWWGEGPLLIQQGYPKSTISSLSGVRRGGKTQAENNDFSMHYGCQWAPDCSTVEFFGCVVREVCESTHLEGFTKKNFRRV